MIDGGVVIAAAKWSGMAASWRCVRGLRAVGSRVGWENLDRLMDRISFSRSCEVMDVHTHGIRCKCRAVRGFESGLGELHVFARQRIKENTLCVAREILRWFWHRGEERRKCASRE